MVPGNGRRLCRQPGEQLLAVEPGHRQHPRRGACRRYADGRLRRRRPHRRLRSGARGALLAGQWPLRGLAAVFLGAAAGARLVGAARHLPRRRSGRLRDGRSGGLLRNRLRGACCLRAGHADGCRELSHRLSRSHARRGEHGRRLAPSRAAPAVAERRMGGGQPRQYRRARPRLHAGDARLRLHPLDLGGRGRRRDALDLLDQRLRALKRPRTQSTLLPRLQPLRRLPDLHRALSRPLRPRPPTRRRRPRPIPIRPSGRASPSRKGRT